MTRPGWRRLGNQSAALLLALVTGLALALPAAAVEASAAASPSGVAGAGTGALVSGAVKYPGELGFHPAAGGADLATGSASQALHWHTDRGCPQSSSQARLGYTTPDSGTVNASVTYLTKGITASSGFDGDAIDLFNFPATQGYHLPGVYQFVVECYAGVKVAAYLADAYVTYAATGAWTYSQAPPGVDPSSLTAASAVHTGSSSSSWKVPVIIAIIALAIIAIGGWYVLGQLGKRREREATLFEARDRTRR
jgi:hypothetical protein